MHMTAQLQDTPVRPRVLDRDGGERIWIARDTVYVKAAAEETGGAYTLLEVHAAPGGGPPPHVHENEEETFYVLDGEFDLLIDDRVVRARAGSYAIVPRGTVHRFTCVGAGPGRMLILFTPGGLDRFFREAGVPATGDGPAPDIDPAEIARTQRAGEQYGLRVVDWRPVARG
jgi:quercetin dioxygenase-like cupin family protein